MVPNKKFLPFQFFFIITFILKIQKIYSTLSFIYPNAVTLINGNIFVIHKYGISICDYSFSTILKNVTTFSISEQISSEDDLSKVTISQFSDGYIVSVIINKIYIFDSFGELKYNGNSLINENDIYFMVSPNNISGNNYNYLIGYIYQNSIYISYYQYNSDSATNSRSACGVGLKDKNYYTILNNGLSCEYMVKDSVDVIVCFFFTSSYYYGEALAISFLYIDRGSINHIYDTNYYPYFENIKCIKSSISDDKSKALFCFFNTQGNTNCALYNIYNTVILSFTYDDCRAKYYALKVYYFSSEIKQYAFSCITNEGSIQVSTLNQNLEESSENTIFLFNECNNIYGHSLIYSINYTNNYIISDIDCDGKSSFEKLISEDSNEDEEEKEKEEEKEEEGIEEENNIEEETKEEEYEEELVENNECKELEKCELCNEESVKKNLCQKCNNKKGYYPLNDNTKSKNSPFIECVNQETKPLNFYYNKDNKEFNPCYEKCATCDKGGDANENNCITCDSNYILKPDVINSTNCIIKCVHFYYYESFNKYKCTNISQCPEKYSKFIKEKLKCIDKCENDNDYKYHYYGECFEECPENTNHTENENNCKDIDINKCYVTEKKLYTIGPNLTNSEIDRKGKEFAKEFIYTNNHVAVFKNNKYNIVLYKNEECISEFDCVDFRDCYDKVKRNYSIDDNFNLVIAIISEKINGKNYQIISYFMYDPISGENLNFSEMCKGASIVVEENLEKKLDNSTDQNTLHYLANQNIDIFNLSSAFYTDICYHFKSPVIGKDIALKDRIKLYFPNITLCDNGCQIKGVNLTSFKAICQCILNNFIGSNIIGNNILLQNSLNELTSMLQETNIEVIRCYKDLSDIQYFISNTGGFIILSLILVQIVLAIIYYCKSLNLLKKYILNLTEKYISYLAITENNLLVSAYKNSLDIKDDKPKKLQNPPKKKGNKNQIEEVTIIKKRGKKRKTKSTKYFKGNMTKGNIMNPKNIVFKNIIIQNNYNHNLNNMNNEDLIQRNISRNKNSTIRNVSFNKDFKNSSDDILINNNQSLNKYKLSNISPQTYLADILKLNIKGDNEVNMEEYLITNPDDMDYDDAIKRDKRSFCAFFFEKLKINQILLNTFFMKDPLRPRPLKIILFLLQIDLYLIVNGLFFSEDYISEMLKVNNEDFLSFIQRFMDRFIYITFVGVIANYIIDCFFVEEKKIKGIFKREKENLIILKYEIICIIKNINSRYNSFIILSFVITIFSFYYVFCFNNIYPSMKVEWIKSSIIIIFTMQGLSILQCFLEACIRFISFECKSEKIYKFSLLLS